MPLEVIAHRGLWSSKYPKNSTSALFSALDGGFGVETDVRDLNGRLVISHDMPTSGCIDLAKFLSYYHANNFDSMLALNIKSDGLCNEVLKHVQNFNLKNYFVFDMSIPDTFSYYNMNIQAYIRESEFENYPLLLNQSSGIWLDQMIENAYDQGWLNEKINLGNNLCFVSPELHKRDHLSFWNTLRLANINNTQNKLMICTDYPEQARNFFK